MLVASRLILRILAIRGEFAWYSRLVFDRLFQLFRGSDPLSVAVELSVIFVGVLFVLRFLQGTRGAGVFKGAIILVAVLLLGIRFAGLFSESFARLRFLSEGLLGAIAVFLLVVFQPELRQAMVRLGQTIVPSERRNLDPLVDSLDEAVGFLSRNRFGALVVIERGTSLAGLAAQGVQLDARLTAPVLESIFWPSSPLHDLAVVIRGERIAAASVQLPLTDETFAVRLGARHRAAVGVTEECDALVVVVSEENGAIRLAESGKLSDPVPHADFAEQLRTRLSRPKRRGQGSLLGAIFGSVGGVDAPVLPTPGLNDEPASIVEAATEAAAAEADATRAHASGSAEDEVETRKEA
jgi:diadenylate cyclase